MLYYVETFITEEGRSVSILIYLFVSTRLDKWGYIGKCLVLFANLYELKKDLVSESIVFII